MNKNKLFRTIANALFASAVLVFSACGSDDTNNHNTTTDGKVDIVKGMVFQVNFADYNSTDTLQTRAGRDAANDTLSREVVKLSNGLLAEVTVKKDTENLQQEIVTTRTLLNDTYTMLAYKPDGTLSGTLTGTVSGGKFTPAATGPKTMILVAGQSYDFVLFNSSVTRNGNSLIVTQENATKAYIGRTTYTVTASTSTQLVAFEMKRAVARVRIQLTANMAMGASTTAVLSSINDTDVPGSAIYDASTGSWSSGEGKSISENLSFSASTEQKYNSATYTSLSDYKYFLPSVNPSKLQLKFTAGTIYRFSMANTEFNLSVPTLTSMVANGSYWIDVKLLYNFLYLMSDGSTGLYNETFKGGGTKTPIGVVISKTNRLAVALKDANNGTTVVWYKTANTNQQNYRWFSTGNKADAFNDMDGYKYTWEPEGSKDRTTKKGEQQTDYPAFYYAGNYGNELSNSGITVTGSMVGKKWHLPSNGEWKYFYRALGIGTTSSMSYDINSPYYGLLAVSAFTQVGGTLDYSWRWSSSEFSDGTVGSVLTHGAYMKYRTVAKNYGNHKVRAFINY